MTSSINIYAGPTALKKLKTEGFQQQHFNVMAGASGGPKWFTLYGLDCYLFGEFFANRKEPIYTIGSSAGAWRMACFSQKDPVAAITRLADNYSRETYSAKPDANEISNKAEVLLDKVLGTSGEQEITNNPLIQSHFIVARAKGLNSFENKWLQMSGLIKAAAANAFSRKTLHSHFERVIFHAKNTSFNESYFNFTDLPTEYFSVTDKNIHQVLMASGSIPLVLRGIKEISGATKGTYRDGGIIDYHLDLNFNTDKLVLYPHFFPSVKPGWFDKGLKNRNASIKNYQNVVMITPSQSFVDALPYKKISDRNDFQNLDDEARLKYWQTILDKSHQMAIDLKLLVETGQGIENIMPIENIL
jgi:hypothetical protein